MTMNPTIRGWGVLLLFTLWPATLVGQVDGPVRLPIAAAEMLPRPYVDPAGSADQLQRLVAARPERLEFRLALARELTAMGVLGRSGEVRIDALTRAAEAARTAIEMDSTSVDAHYWYAAARGLHADQSGGRDKIERAREAHAHALAALALDPLHPGANHILGRLHAGTLRLSWASRMIGRLLGLGDIMDEASWESAESRMRLAATEEPDNLVHRVELAKLLIRLERAGEGRAILERLAAREPRHALDAYYRQAAVRELERLEER